MISLLSFCLIIVARKQFLKKPAKGWKISFPKKCHEMRPPRICGIVKFDAPSHLFRDCRAPVEQGIFAAFPCFLFLSLSCTYD